VGCGVLPHSFQEAANHPTFISDRNNKDACTLLNSSRVAFSSHILGSSTIVQRAVQQATKIHFRRKQLSSSAHYRYRASSAPIWCRAGSVHSHCLIIIIIHFLLP